MKRLIFASSILLFLGSASLQPSLAAETQQRSPTPTQFNLARSKATTMRDVRRVYVMPFNARDGGFRSNVMRSLRGWNRIQLVSSPKSADAVVTGSGRSTGQGFRGELQVRSTKDNSVLWSGTALRRDRTRDRMAFDQLVSRLKSEVGN